MLVETQNTVRELSAATRWAIETGLPVVASMVTDGRGHLLSGESIEEAAVALASLRLDAVSINCVAARRLESDLAILAGAARGMPLAAYGNLGPPAGEGDTVFTQDVAPEDYASLAREWIATGARTSGCCNPAYMSGIRQAGWSAPRRSGCTCPACCTREKSPCWPFRTLGAAPGSRT